MDVDRKLLHVLYHELYGSQNSHLVLKSIKHRLQRKQICFSIWRTDLLLRSCWVVMKAGQVSPCSRWKTRHSSGWNTWASMFWYIHLNQVHPIKRHISGVFSWTLYLHLIEPKGFHLEHLYCISLGIISMTRHGNAPYLVCEASPLWLY